MCDFDDYIKCGEILLSPSIHDKDQFLLKCSDCEKYYCDLQLFIPHWQRHYNDSYESDLEMDMDETQEEELQEEKKMKLKTLTIKTEIKHEKESGVDELEDVITEPSEQYIIECNNDLDLEDEKPEYTDQEIHIFIESDGIENIYAEEEKPAISEDEAENENQENNDDDEDIDENYENSNDGNSEEAYHTDDHDRQDTSSPENKDNKFKINYKSSRGYKFIREFFNTKKNVLTFIDLYKNQKNLWEIGVSAQLTTQQRIKHLEEIARDFESKIALKLTLDQIRDIIAYLRSKHRIAAMNANKAEWYVPHLSFLRTSSYNATIDKLGPHTLRRSQIIQLLAIYKQFPFLWNTNLVEYVCNNKRDEALQQMQNVIQTKMKITTEMIDVKRYVNDINMFCSREKRMEMKNVDPDKISEYYDDMKYLRDHVSPFACDLCNKKVVHPLKFKMHLNSHDGGVDSIDCKICGKVYNTLEPYIQHCRRHMDDLPVECTECGKRFIREADMRLHMRTHTGVKPYCCEICGTSFRHSNALLLHTRRHKKLYCYSCSLCPRQFYSKNELTNHMDIHGEERKRICKICGKGFKTKSTLKSHTLTHETELKHPCELCGKLFKNRLGIYHHMKTHRRKEPQDN